MTNKDIARVIRSVNRGSRNVVMLATEGRVRKARVWNARRDRDLTYWFVFEPDGACVAAIFDGGPYDLMAYTSRKFRRRGIIAQALRHALHDLAASGRESQRVTYSVLRPLVMRLGGRESQPGVAEIDLTVYFPDSLASPRARRTIHLADHLGWKLLARLDGAGCGK